MSSSSVGLKVYGAEEFLSAENLNLADETVAEIFKMMFGLEAAPVEHPGADLPASEADERTALVGFSGAMRGSCQVRIGSGAARSIASAMLGGMPIEEDDDSIDDALGELCNMLGGGWKNRIPALSSECALSPPTVISGRDYKVHMHKPSVQLNRIYEFDSHLFRLTLHCEDIAPVQE